MVVVDEAGTSGQRHADGDAQVAAPKSLRHFNMVR